MDLTATKLVRVSTIYDVLAVQDTLSRLSVRLVRQPLAGARTGARAPCATDPIPRFSPSRLASSRVHYEKKRKERMTSFILFDQRIQRNESIKRVVSKERRHATSYWIGQF